MLLFDIGIVELSIECISGSFYSALKNVASNEWATGGWVMAAAGLDGWLITPTRSQPDIYLPPTPPGVSVHVDLLSDGRLVVRREGPSA